MTGGKGAVMGCLASSRTVVCSVFPDPNTQFVTARHEQTAGVTPELL